MKSSKIDHISNAIKMFQLSNLRLSLNCFVITWRCDHIFSFLGVVWV